MKKVLLLGLFVFCLVFTTVVSAVATQYVRRQLTDLGSDACALMINDDGYIAGLANSSFDGLPHIVRWKPDGSIEDLGPGYLHDVNEAGSVLGRLLYSSCNVWDITGNCEALPWELNPIGFNDHGQFVGSHLADNGFMQADIWTEAEGLRGLDMIPGYHNWAYKINNSGVIAGEAGYEQQHRAVRWTADGEATLLPLLPGSNQSSFSDINEAGQIVGYCATDGGNIRAVLWEADGTAVFLCLAFTYAINDRGQIALSWAEIRNPDGSIDQLEPTNPYNSFVYDINNHGVAVGTIPSGGRYVAVVWEPVPEVQIDIKPGDSPNAINLKSRGSVPVAILTTSIFDVSTVDPDSVRFAGAAAAHWSEDDVDNDGDVDLIMHFKIQDLNLSVNSTEALATGRAGGVEFRAVDAVTIVPRAR